MKSISTPQVDSSTIESAGLKVAKTLAPEDVTIGDFIAISHETFEFPSFFWGLESGKLPAHEATRIRFTTTHPGKPVEVVGICLPFILVSDSKESYSTLDVRQCGLFKLDPEFAKLYRKKMKKSQKSKSSSCLE